MKDEKKNRKNEDLEEDQLDVDETNGDELDEDLEKKEDVQLEKLKAESEEYKSSYKRALADYQNLERRVREERRDLIRSANKELVLRLLPVLDILTLASAHSEDQGLHLSIQQFLDVLKSEGVERIVTKDKQFDPHIMEVIDTVEGEDGKVIEEVRSGYMLMDKVLRPAQVKVGKSQ